MRKSALAKKYSDTPVRQETRRLLWRWGRTAGFCKQTNSEMQYFQDRVDEVSDLRARAQIKVRGGQTSDPTARAAEDLEKLEKEYAECVRGCSNEVTKAIQFKTAIDDIMRNDLLPEERELLTLRYKNGWGWIMIASKLCIEESCARKRERRALDKIARKMLVNQKSPV